MMFVTRYYGVDFLGNCMGHFFIGRLCDNSFSNADWSLEKVMLTLPYFWEIGSFKFAFKFAFSNNCSCIGPRVRCRFSGKFGY